MLLPPPALAALLLQQLLSCRMRLPNASFLLAALAPQVLVDERTPCIEEKDWDGNMGGAQLLRHYRHEPLQGGGSVQP